jgi:hypothetical protein
MRPSRTPATIVLSALLLALAGTATANEFSAFGVSRGVEIVSAERTLQELCSIDSFGRTWIDLPGGARYELVTSVDDPAIANPGDGSFHPFDPAEVQAALGGVTFPLDDVNVEVVILPYPRRVQLESAAAPGLILLSPGVRPLSSAQQHAEFTHELGHVIQYALMPDSDGDSWSRYRRLRGIADEARYSATAPHANRPHEIFAEDFRALFGDALANYSGTIENAGLVPPRAVSGLADFMLGLAGGSAVSVELAAWPNPTAGAIRFTSAKSALVPLDLFDPSGRRIATLEPLRTGSTIQWVSDGRDAGGRRYPPGVLFARPRAPGARAVRIVVQP